MAVVGAGRVAGPATVSATQAVGGFELEFSLPGAGRRREPLPVCAGERFEDAVPARPFRFGKGLASFAGWWWMASTGRHVGFESWLERDHLMLLDFDPDVTAVSSQPFWLRWRGKDGRDRRHAPDFFARLADGTGVVVDIRPSTSLPAPSPAGTRCIGAASTVGQWALRPGLAMVIAPPLASASFRLLLATMRFGTRRSRRGNPWHCRADRLVVR